MPQPLNYMRWHEHNTTKKNLENGYIHRDKLRVLNYYFERLLHSHIKSWPFFLKTITSFHESWYLRRKILHY